MDPIPLIDWMRKLVRVGETNGRPWAIVRFKDFWDNGLASSGKENLENALHERLKEAGIELEFDPEFMDWPTYVTFVSYSGMTVYVGRTKSGDWGNAAEMFDAVKEVLDNN